MKLMDAKTRTALVLLLCMIGFGFGWVTVGAPVSRRVVVTVVGQDSMPRAEMDLRPKVVHGLEQSEPLPPVQSPLPGRGSGQDDFSEQTI